MKLKPSVKCSFQSQEKCNFLAKQFQAVQWCHCFLSMSLISAQNLISDEMNELHHGSGWKVKTTSRSIQCRQQKDVWEGIRAMDWERLVYSLWRKAWISPKELITLMAVVQQNKSKVQLIMDYRELKFHVAVYTAKVDICVKIRKWRW